MNNKKNLTDSRLRARLPGQALRVDLILEADVLITFTNTAIRGWPGIVAPH